MAIVGHWNYQTFAILHIHIWRGKCSSDILTTHNVFIEENILCNLFDMPG